MPVLLQDYTRTLVCSYDTNYQNIYQPSYDTVFIFYDEEELCEEEVEISDFVELPFSIH